MYHPASSPATALSTTPQSEPLAALRPAEHPGLHFPRHEHPNDPTHVTERPGTRARSPRRQRAPLRHTHHSNRLQNCTAEHVLGREQQYRFVPNVQHTATTPQVAPIWSESQHNTVAPGLGQQLAPAALEYATPEIIKTNATAPETSNATAQGPPVTPTTQGGFAHDQHPPGRSCVGQRRRRLLRQCCVF